MSSISEQRQDRYGSSLDFGGKTGREWLGEFRSDLGAIISALDDWQQKAGEISYGAQDCNYSPGPKLDIPSWFWTLTDIIALWCDAELHIDPTALCDFRRRMDDFRGHNRIMPDGKVGLHRIPMKDSEIESCFFAAKQTLDRVIHATFARATAKQQAEVLARLSPATANEDRDKWLYSKCCRLVAYGTIVRDLAKKSKWEPIESIQGVKQAANRYATSHNLPLIPSRQPGRPSK